jgi:hypothetical protein
MFRIQAMPPRRRPTARLLSPAGWIGVTVFLSLAGAFAAMTLLAR